MNDQSQATQKPEAARKPEGAKPSGHAQLQNMGLALRTMIELQQAGEGSPRLGVLFSPSGYGKSVAAAFTAQRTGAGYTEAKSVWTQKTLLLSIAHELAITNVANSSPDIFQQIVDQLNVNPRPLIIDEMDYLVKKKAVDIIRDIHDSTSVPILMIGMESLPAKLKAWEQFDNRILVFTQAEPASADDVIKLRDCYRKSIDIADDLALYFSERCKGITRRIINNLRNAERVAAEEGVMQIDRQWWGNRPVVTGDVPIRRHVA